MVEVFTVLWYNDENNLSEANMIYKNGIKEYTLAGVMFGTPMGLIVGFMRLNLPLGIIAGFLCGFLFALIIFIFVKFQEKSFDKKRIEIAKEKKSFAMAEQLSTETAVGCFLPIKVLNSILIK